MSVMASFMQGPMKSNAFCTHAKRLCVSHSAQSTNWVALWTCSSVNCSPVSLLPKRRHTSTTWRTSQQGCRRVVQGAACETHQVEKQSGFLHVGHVAVLARREDVLLAHGRLDLQGLDHAGNELGCRANGSQRVRARGHTQARTGERSARGLKGDLAQSVLQEGQLASEALVHGNLADGHLNVLSQLGVKLLLNFLRPCAAREERPPRHHSKVTRTS